MASKKSRRYAMPSPSLPDEVPPETPAETSADAPVRIRIKTDKDEIIANEHDRMSVPGSSDVIEAGRVQIGQKLVIDGAVHVVCDVGFA